MPSYAARKAIGFSRPGSHAGLRMQGQDGVSQQEWMSSPTNVEREGCNVIREAWGCS
jgi:hypothetical protein